MSVQRRCDICDAPKSTWLFRKRWKVFQVLGMVRGDSYYDWKDEIDICDKCIQEFKNFVYLKKETKSGKN